MIEYPAFLLSNTVKLEDTHSVNCRLDTEAKKTKLYIKDDMKSLACSESELFPLALERSPEDRGGDNI